MARFVRVQPQSLGCQSDRRIDLHVELAEQHPYPRSEDMDKNKRTRLETMERWSLTQERTSKHRY